MVSNTNVLNDLDYKKVGTDRWAVRICLNVNPATLSHPCTPTGLIDHQRCGAPSGYSLPQHTVR